ncbi:hypothetical protein NP233_g11351 [Leucocoprinus birnbaumii]|uniref:Uncharacterized protein n=1 Tax=Leucocoprinus birnbaumii TaxID=56174 RepID=A0AAD5YR14_9AGAR|nr:hypothetical protein NP233_g11351 [Leucocoprinus birnbaumii]
MSRAPVCLFVAGSGCQNLVPKFFQRVLCMQELGYCTIVLQGVTGNTLADYIANSDLFNPFTLFTATAYCLLDKAKDQSYGANRDANANFQPTASRGDGLRNIRSWYIGFDPDLSTAIVTRQGSNSKVTPLLNLRTTFGLSIRGEIKPVKNGIPQGSPVSPILATFYSAGLLDMFENPDTAVQIPDNLKHDKPTCVSILMYVDDRKLVVSSHSINTNNRLLAQAYQMVDQWLWKAGLAPDQDKQHVKRMSARAEAAIGCISMLANTVCGLSHKHLRVLYKTCVLPIMTYASAVWWTGKTYHVKHLRLVQNRALRLICTAFKTTPINALEVEGSIPPIQLHLDYLNRKAGICLNKLSVSSPVIQRLPPTWSDTHKPETDLHSGLACPTQLNKIASMTAPNHERIFPFLLPLWQKTSADYVDRFIINAETGPKDEAAAVHLQCFAELHNNPEHIIVYSDGSQRLIKKTLLAELTGMAMGLKAAINKASETLEIHHIHIYANNVSAIGTIHDPKPRQGQLLALSFYNDMIKWLDAHPGNKLSVEWCPGHADISGNECADTLAKKAVSLASSSDPTTTYNLCRAHETVTTSWRQPHHSNQPSTSRTLKTSARSLADSCSAELDMHSMSYPLYERCRDSLHDISPTIHLPDILGTKEGIATLAHFIEKSGAFTKNGHNPPTRHQPTIDDRPLKAYMTDDPKDLNG